MEIKRITEIKETLEQNSATIISSTVNRFYLSGFRSSAGNILITKNSAILLIDFRYYEKAKNTVKDLDVRLCNNPFADIKEILKKENIKNVYLETDYITIESLDKIRTALDEFDILNDNKISKKLSYLRQIKSAKEITLINSAQSITDKAFEHILNFIKVGVTEKDIALELELFMRKNGSDGVAFDTIAVSGKNSSLPHGVPTDKPLENGDFLTMDFGAVYSGYCSDMTRTVAIGYVTDKQQAVYDTVLKAQLAALNSIAPQKPCNEVDKIARDIIKNAGFGDNFGHGLGHSVGLEIHENPACNTRDTTLLSEGMIMTVEPGIYLPDKFGVRIEDMIVITNHGYNNLTKSPKELIII